MLINPFCCWYFSGSGHRKFARLHTFKHHSAPRLKDSKRNGRASVKTLWEGWLKLQTILESYEFAQFLEKDS
ncbi:hypothetical protein CEP70_09465 [Providencia stuartii]|nr:hypothetical protein CEP70_09465 [Providencia stuartii]